jgi:hypothetical protein
MIRPSTRLAAVAIAAAALCSTHATGRAASVKGHWQSTFTVLCHNSSDNAALCRHFFGNLRAVGKTGTTLEQQGTDVYTVAASGQYSDRGQMTLWETARARKPTNCGTDPGARLFDGQCVITWTGHGHITAGPNGLSIFYEDAETIKFAGAKGTLNLQGSQANSGPPTPAKVGAYPVSWAANAVGIKRVPAAVTAELIITRGR